MDSEENRQLGRPPIDGEPMINTHKRLSLPKSLLDWLEAQENQAETIRQSLELLKDDPLAVSTFPSVGLEARCNLPERPLVYLVLSSTNDVLYIGQSKNGKARWSGHDKLRLLQNLKGIRIAWIEVNEVFLLRLIENALIKFLEPPLNKVGGRINRWEDSTKTSETLEVVEVLSNLSEKLQERMLELEKIGINKRKLAALLYQKRLKAWEEAHQKGRPEGSEENKPKSAEALYSTIRRAINDPEYREVHLFLEIVELMGGLIPSIVWCPPKYLQYELEEFTSDG